MRGRGRLLLGWIYDLGTLAVALAAASVLATFWMLARTEWGAVDLETGEAVIALSMALAVGPAWTTWQWLQLRRHSATFGARHSGSWDPPESRSPARHVRRWWYRALHPVTLPLWLWVSITLVVTDIAVLRLVAMLPVALLLSSGLLLVASSVLLLARPAAAPLHIWFARASGGRGR